MADNYLERKMEDYRRGSNATRRVLTHSGDTPGTLRLKLRPRPVLIYGAQPCHESLVVLLTGAGFRVAITSADAAWGQKTAQRTGALFVPDGTDAEEVFLRRCGGVAAVRVDAEQFEGSPKAYALRVIAQIVDADER
ncbi:MAG: hypothetical protein K2F74_06365 [Muribaculaceae bacterium]|nr:hypothetical protein [Muribaculaceae bacterium]